MFSDLTLWLGLWRDYPSLVKVSLFLLFWLIFWLPIAVPLGKKLGWNPLRSATPQQKLPLVASLYLLVPLMVWLTLQVDGESLTAYGLSWTGNLARSLLLGILLGLGGLLLIFTLESRCGFVQWQTQNFSRLIPLALPLLILGLWVGITEELLFRGIFLNQLQADYPLWLAASLSSMIFALLHLLWERQSTLPQLPGLWLMGMILVLARWVDHGSLGLAWGLHAAWVWGLASLDAAELLIYPPTSPVWIVGIGKQPLAGIAGLSCLLLTGLALWTLLGTAIA
ncbi:MAG: CPBP family intramembrane glutamic endopeptidase [Snowella sp.]|nr:CPBP family intramembrane glutamic endopeptidase [Snowella sp.]